MSKMGLFQFNTKAMPSNRGSSLIELLIVSLLSVGVIVAAGTQLKVSSEQTAFLRRTNSFQEISFEVQKSLTQQSNWLTTFNSSANLSNFNCLKTSGICSAGTEFIAFDAKNNIVFGPAATNSGYNNEGQPCSNYPSVSCSYRAHLSWTPLCTSLCPTKIPIMLNFTWTAPNSVQNMKLLGFSIYKEVPNPGIINSSSSTTVNFWNGISQIPYGSTYINTTEGAAISFKLQLSATRPAPTEVTVCKIFGGSVKASFYVNYYYLTTTPPEPFSSDCKPYIIPANTAVLTINDTIPDDNVVLNRNTGNRRYSYAIQGSPDVQVGNNSQFDVSYTDNDNYLVLESAVSTAAGWEVSYRHNQEYCAYLELIEAPNKRLTFQCPGQIYPTTFCFRPAPLGKKLFIPNTCQPPIELVSGKEVILRAGNAEGVNTSGKVVWP